MSELSKRIISSLVIIPLSFFFIIMGSFYFNFFLVVCFLFSVFEWKKIALNKISFYVGVIFLILSFYSCFKIRGNNIEDNLLIFVFIIVICISTDIGGYTFGKLFKGPKLTKISPNKTYSGMIGSFIFAIIFSYSFFIFFKDQMYVVLQNLNIFLIIIILSFVSQIGDLTISYFKRISKLDDTGNLIPGHGGILDRIDGIIFVFPFIYLINLFLKLI